MEYIAIIISLAALVGAGFAFLRANSSHNILGKRIESLKEKNGNLEARLRKLEGSGGRGPKGEGTDRSGLRGRRRVPDRQLAVLLSTGPTEGFHPGLAPDHDAVFALAELPGKFSAGQYGAVCVGAAESPASDCPGF